MQPLFKVKKSDLSKSLTAHEKLSKLSPVVIESEEHYLYQPSEKTFRQLVEVLNGGSIQFVLVSYSQLHPDVNV